MAASRASKARPPNPLGTVAADPPAALPYPAYPKLEPTHGLLVFLAAFNLTGVATIAAGIVGRRSLLWKGIFQILLTPILIGIVWAIVSGYRILKNAQA